MRRSQAATLATWLALSMVPWNLNAAEQATQSSAAGSRDFRQSKQIIDCACRESGCVQGRVVDRAGRPVSKAVLTLSNSRGKVASTMTDDSGEFKFQGAGTGLFAFRIASGPSRHLRVWNSEVAPPRAVHNLLFVSGDDVVRAQGCDGGVGCDGCETCRSTSGAKRRGLGFMVQRVLDNPWLVAAGTATAIAVPLAVGDDDERAGDEVDAISGAGEDAS